jgi:predicted nuclease with TOPRIM domain
MSDNITQGVGDPRSFEERVFARFDAMDARFDKVDARLDALETRVGRLEENVLARFALVEVRLDRLEQLVDKRLLETRPIWEGIQFEIRRFNARMDQFVEEIFELRSDQRVTRKRVDALEGITS